jgi:hypothetical protein
VQCAFQHYQRDAVRQPQAAIRTYLLAITLFCNEVKSMSALALSRDLGTSCKTAFVLAHKMREAMAGLALVSKPSVDFSGCW